MKLRLPSSPGSAPRASLSVGEAVALLTALIGGRAEADQAAAERLAEQCARLPLALRVAAELAVSRPDTPLAALTADLGQ